MGVGLLDNKPGVHGQRADIPGRRFDEAQALGRIGSLETRLAVSEAEIDAAQAIRFRIFSEEMGARLSPDNMRAKRDRDSFDPVCDHLIVVDNDIVGDPEDQIVGTYRLCRDDVARQHGGFYSSSEFDIDALIARHSGKRFMELGRSCVLPAYRTKRTVELLWQGAWAYALMHNVDAMFGCASFSGTRPEAHAVALSFLHHNFRASDEWMVRALPQTRREMDLMPAEAFSPRRALSMLPPLIKGYVRLGAMVGDGAFVDYAFRTTDVMIVLPIAHISGRYINYYGANAGRFA